ncbi:hypothetical protein EBS02_08215 [bacterium]|nr:hypothetical protein [bacterium]
MRFEDLILFLNSNSNFRYSDVGEAETGGAASTTASVYPTVTKWETGLTRSVANTIDSKVKWNTLYKTSRGKSNTLL